MTTLSVCAYMTISTHTHVYIYFKILTIFRIETAIVGVSACVLVLTMIYDNKNFIVALALHASRIEKERRSERERESIAIRKLHIYRCEICCIFPMKNHCLPLIQNSPSINYINCTLTARVFPMISQQSLSLANFLSLLSHSSIRVILLLEVVVVVLLLLMLVVVVLPRLMPFATAVAMYVHRFSACFPTVLLCALLLSSLLSMSFILFNRYASEAFIFLKPILVYRF